MTGRRCATPPAAIELAGAPVCLAVPCAEPISLVAVDSTWKHSFQRELDIAIKLQHPNVIEIYDVIFWDRSALSFASLLPAAPQRPFRIKVATPPTSLTPAPRSRRYVCLVMEYASGGELFTQVANGGPMSEDRARQYFKQIVSAASHCHSQGICHRDLKLENILLGADKASAALRSASHIAKCI
eukprot:COSAG02_NODE_1870_length_10588_cov_78.982652_3_plen_185_part_00